MQLMPSDPGVNEEEAERLLAPLGQASHVLVAASGGADSTALLVLAAEWSKRRGAKLSAATVDHGLRRESAGEAKRVAAFAKSLGVPHRVLVWRGDKPQTGIEEAARTARYALLDAHARKLGASHLVTAHTRDDQAETLLMRLAAGSGPAGLAGMRGAVRRGHLIHVRPLLDVPKARLVAMLKRRGIGWSEDETNLDPRFARGRLRQSRAVLDREGLTDERLAVLARRMARANDALDRVAAAAWIEAARTGHDGTELDGAVLLALPEEIALRILNRAVGSEGGLAPDRLARSEALLAAVREALAEGRTLGRTLAGAKVAVKGGKVTVSAAPPRRSA